jgi:chorismate-pyruvate lyase
MDTIEPLFAEYDLPKFIAPTPRQVQAWLQQTKGSMTNELRIARRLPSDVTILNTQDP